MTRTGIVFALTFASGLLHAQPPFQVYGQNLEDRASTRIGYWRTDKNAGIGELVVSYGRPPWKASYDEELDRLTRGKMWRMGDNYWTLLDTNLPVRVGGQDVSAGLYYLAVRRSQDGATWELVFIDPEKSRAAGLDAYDVGTRPDEIPVLFSVPFSFEQSAGTVERLTILLSLDEGSNTKGSMRLSWGNFALVTPVEIALPKKTTETP